MNTPADAPLVPWRGPHAGDRPMVLPLFLAIFLHGLVALAWQPKPFPPAQETVLQAVLLPPVQARPEDQPPEPPPPERQPRAKSRVSTPAWTTAAELSDGLAESSVAAAPEAPQAVLSSARPIQAARSDAPGAASLSEAERAPAAPLSNRVAALAPSGVDTRTGHPLLAAGSRGGGLSLPVAGVATPAPTPTPTPTPSLPRRDGLSRGAAAAAPASVSDSHAESAMTPVGGGQTVRSAPPPGVPATLMAARASEAAGQPRPGTGPVGLTGEAGMAAVRSAPAAAMPVGLAKVAQVGETRSVAASRGSASLADIPVPPGTRAAPGDSAPASLARALPGRPVAVSGGGEGSNEFVDYADDNPEFVYPRQAARLGLEGSVLLEVEVLPDGRVGAIRLGRSSGSDMLDRDAVRQMATWRFKPALRYGRAHAARVTVPVNYRLEPKGRP